jgi:hypothetical protein
MIPFPNEQNAYFGHWNFGYYLIVGVWNLVLLIEKN